MYILFSRTMYNEHDHKKQHHILIETQM